MTKPQTMAEWTAWIRASTSADWADAVREVNATYAGRGKDFRTAAPADGTTPALFGLTLVRSLIEQGATARRGTDPTPAELAAALAAVNEHLDRDIEGTTVIGGPAATNDGVVWTVAFLRRSLAGAGGGERVTVNLTVDLTAVREAVAGVLRAVDTLDAALTAVEAGGR